MSKAETEKIRYSFLKRSGLCLGCKGRNTAIPGRTRCEECRDKDYKRYEARKRAKVCVGGCGSKAAKDRTRCHTCLKKTNERSREYQDKLIARGFCIMCRKNPVNLFSRCGSCRTKIHETWIMNKQEKINA